MNYVLTIVVVYSIPFAYARLNHHFPWVSHPTNLSEYLYTIICTYICICNEQTYPDLTSSTICVYPCVYIYIYDMISIFYL